MFSLLLKLVLDLIGRTAQVQRSLESISAALVRIESQVAQVADVLVPGPAVKFLFIAELEGVVQIVEGFMDIRDDQQVHLTIQPVDKKGKPASVDGVPTWAVSDATVITAAAALDGLSADVVAVAPGQARVVVTADADLGAGVTPVTGMLDFTVTPGGAVAINIVPGTPTAQV